MLLTNLNIGIAKIDFPTDIYLCLEILTNPERVKHRSRIKRFAYLSCFINSTVSLASTASNPSLHNFSVTAVWA